MRKGSDGAGVSVSRAAHAALAAGARPALALADADLMQEQQGGFGGVRHQRGSDQESRRHLRAVARSSRSSEVSSCTSSTSGLRTQLEASRAAHLILMRSSRRLELQAGRFGSSPAQALRSSRHLELRLRTFAQLETCFLLSRPRRQPAGRRAARPSRAAAPPARAPKSRLPAPPPGPASA